MALTNREFAHRVAQIAKRSNTWVHETLGAPDDVLAQPMATDSADRFCREIKEMLDKIHPLARSD